MYSDTPMAAKKPVSGVPTVLFVDPKGEIHEEDNIRDEGVMKKAMTESSPIMSEEDSEDEEESEEEESEESDEPMLRTSEVSDGDQAYGLRPSEVSDGVTEASVFRPAKNRTATPYPDSIRGTTEVEDTLPALPATPIRTLTMTGGSYKGSYTGSQRGGDPFSAFVAVARQAAPAAALLAAYGLLPKNKRSSGLGAARRSRRNRKTKRRRD